MASATITVDTSRAVDRFGRLRERLAVVGREGAQEAAQAAVPAYQVVAPKVTGKLAREIHADDGQVISDVRSSRGFSYSPTTRFGRRGFSALPGGPMLRFSVGGRTIFRRSVGPYVPAGDWAAKGHAQGKRLAADRFGRLVRDAVERP